MLGLWTGEAHPYLRRIDCDDVLFVLSNPVELAVLQFTNTPRPPEQPPWPMTETYDGVGKFVDQALRDGAEYARG